MNKDLTSEELLTPAEVAAIFKVDPKTVTRWAQQGKLRSRRTLGGHRRFFAEDFRELMNTEEGTTKLWKRDGHN